MSIVSGKYQSKDCDPDLCKLFQEESREILDYIQETLLELTQPTVSLEFPDLTIALAMDFMRILQSDAADLGIIEVQISAYRLEILLDSIQATKVVEINEIQTDTTFSRQITLDSKLKRDLLEAGQALKLSLLPYLNTDSSAMPCVVMETPPSSMCQDSTLDFNPLMGTKLPTLDEFQILEDIENIHSESSELMLPTANLLVWLAGSDIFTIPYDRIETSLMPKAEQIIPSAGRDFLQWQQQPIPIYQLSELLSDFTLPELNSSSIRSTVFSTEMKLILIIRQGEQLIALESAIERLVTQPELMIQPLNNPLSYCYGFSWWENQSLVRVIDVAVLLEQIR